MAVYIVTGPVSVGKRKFAETTKCIMERLGKKVHVASISDIMNEYKRKYRVNSQPMQETIQRAIKEGLVDKLTTGIATSCINHKEKYGKTFDDIIITMPLAVMGEHGVVEAPRDGDSLQAMMKTLQNCFDQQPGCFITLIEDPRKILRTMHEENEIAYARSTLQLLEWTTMDVTHTEHLAWKLFDGRWLTLPVELSNTSLAKIMCDMHGEKESRVAYTAHPISEIIKMENNPQTKALALECWNRLQRFKEKLQEYCVVISPIELRKNQTIIEHDSLLKKIMENFTAEKPGADGVKLLENALTKTVFSIISEHTVHRDLYWFVRMGEVIAYYPMEIDSPGAENEINEAISMRKKVLFVKDKIPGAIELQDDGTGAKSSPFAFGKRLDEKNIFENPDQFFSSQEKRYTMIEDEYKKMNAVEEKKND